MITIAPLSQCVNGAPIAVAATSSPGTILHTSSGTPTQNDELFVYACNTGTATTNLFFQLAGTGSNNVIVNTIPASGGLSLQIPGCIITSGQSLRAYASVTNNINVVGYYQRGP